MEKNEIQYRLKNVKTLANFAKLLNDVKIDEFNTEKYKITEMQKLILCYFILCRLELVDFDIIEKLGKVFQVLDVL